MWLIGITCLNGVQYKKITPKVLPQGLVFREYSFQE